MPNLKISDFKTFVGAIDFDASRDFYVALGWEVTYDSPELRVMELQGGNRFYLQKYYVQQWCENSMLHLAVESVGDWFEFVSGVFEENTFQGQARISGPPKDEGYAVTFHIWDPAGVLIHVAQFK